MAGGGERLERSASIRRRLTTLTQKVMRYTSLRRSTASGSIIEPATPVVAEPAAAAAPAAPAAAATAPAAAAAAAPAAAAPAVTATRLTPVPALAADEPVHRPYRPPKVPTTPPPIMSAAERAQALFKKHGLEVKPSDLPLSTKPLVDRVQKDIRMRVHRSCHRCETPFGADKCCLNCQHKRCKKCPRHPLKKSKDKGKEKVTTKTGMIAPGYKKRKGDIAYGITLPGRRGGQDLVHKEARQRVHRKCHRCETDFGSEKVCGKCKHNRCNKCPRYPSKPGKDYSKYDPSDSEPEYPPPPRRTYKRPRRRVHWTCSKCSTTFIEKTRECGKCGSNRDDTGIRDPPKKPKFKPTDIEVQRLNDRLKQTSLTAA